MAKLGEGDARWIVDERQDGANVNGWHWTEKDVTPQAKARFAEIVAGVTLYKDDTTEVKIKGVESFTGEVNVHSRKGKVMCLYEMNLKLEWSGTVKFPDDAPEEDFEVEGTIHMPEVETDDDDYEINVNLEKKKKNPEHIKVKDLVQRAAPAIMRGLVKQLLSDMRDIVAAKTPTPTREKSQGSVALDVQAPIDKNKSDTAKSQSVSMSKQFAAPPGEIFECLMDQGRVSMFTQSHCRISRDAGGEFELLGGAISGKQIEIIPGEKIVQSWRFEQWPAGHFSTVTIKLDEGGPGTKLSLKQTNIPADEIERVKYGWENQFWSRIKQVFGF